MAEGAKVDMEKQHEHFSMFQGHQFRGSGFFHWMATVSCLFKEILVNVLCLKRIPFSQFYASFQTASILTILRPDFSAHRPLEFSCSNQSRHFISASDVRGRRYLFPVFLHLCRRFGISIFFYLAILITVVIHLLLAALQWNVLACHNHSILFSYFSLFSFSGN